MLAYWLMFSIFAMGSIGKQRVSAMIPRHGPLFFLAIAFLMLLVGLRFEVGGDWRPYYIIFDNARDMPWGSVLAIGDPGYMLLNRIAWALGTDVWFVNLACAVLFGWGLAVFANDQPDPWLAVVVALPYLVLVVAMGYTRQAVAIGLMMAAIPSFERRRYLSFFVLIALATTFHKTVVVMIPLIALSTQRHRLVVLTTAAALGAMVFIFFINLVLDSLVRGYVDAAMKSDGAGTRIAMTLLAAALYLPFQRRFAITDQERVIWRNFALVAVLFSFGLLFSSASTVVDRISLYLIPLQIFVLSRLPMAFPRQGRVNALLIALVILYSGAIMFVWLTFASHSFAWLPYQNYLFL